MYNIRAFDIPTESPQYVVEEPIHLPKIDTNYKKCYLSLKSFHPLSYIKNAFRRNKRWIKSNTRSVVKKGKNSSSRIVKPFVD